MDYSTHNHVTVSFMALVCAFESKKKKVTKHVITHDYTLKSQSFFTLTDGKVKVIFLAKWKAIFFS